MRAPDFAGASKEVLAFLHARMGMALWMVTRADDEDWVVLQADDRGYGVAGGDVFRWADTFCARMVRDGGPHIAPRTADVPAYADAALTLRLPVGAYAGVPLVDAEGALFGTLCGLHPTPLPATIVAEQPMLEVLAGMLSGLLAAELQTTALTRQAETARSELLTDALTGLANARGWDAAIATEEERCRRYGATACIVVVEADLVVPPLDDADAAQRALAGQALREIVRRPDTLARLDEGRFAVLGVECTSAEALALLRRLELGLQAAGVPAALGMAMRHRSAGLVETFERARHAMEEHRDVRARGWSAGAPQ